MLLLVAALFISGRAAAQAVPELMYFRFDTPGPTVSNEAAPATRVSTNGTLTASTIGSTGQFGTALQGNGSTSIPFDAGWATNLSGPWTMSMWFSGVTNALPGNYLFGASGTSAFRAFTGSGLVAGAGNLLVRGGIADIQINGIFDAAGTPVVVTIVYDPSVPNSRVYINGVLNLTVAQTATVTVTGTNFTIGNYAASTGLNTGGKMDEFRLYNRALTAAEITATWNQPLPLVTTCSGTPAASVITTPPMTAPICNNSVTLTGTNPNGTSSGAMMLQWEQAAAAAGPWSAAVGGSGANTLTYTTPNITTPTWYRLKITCPTTSLSSNSAAYAVLVASPTPAAISGSSTFCPGASQIYSVPSMPTVTSYNWTLPSGWTGAANSNQITAVAGATGGTISLTVSGPCGVSAAQTKTVTIGTAPARPDTMSGNTVACTGAIQTYSVPSVTGANTYNWTLPAGWTGTSTTNSITVTPGANGGTISVTAANLCGTSAARTLAVTTTTQPAPAGTISGTTSVCAGAAETYTVIPVPGALSYTWTLPGGWSGTSTGTVMPANTGSTGGNVVVRANNGCGTGANATLAVSILPTLAPAVTISSNDTSICSGELVTFSATPVNGGTTPSYTWLVNGVAVGIGSTYTNSTLANGNSVTVKLTSSYRCPTAPDAFSNPIIMIVSPQVLPGININMASSPEICAGTVATFTANVNGGGTAPSYQWKINGANVGANTPTFSTNLINNGDSVYCVLTSNAACATSTEVTSNKIGVRVLPNVTATVSIIANPGTNLQPGQSVTFIANVVNGGASPLYQWTKNGADIPGANSVTYTTNTLKNGDYIRIRVMGSNMCATPGTMTSNNLLIRVATGVSTIAGISDFALLPNPNTGSFVLTGNWAANMNGRQVKVAVVNMVGQTIYTAENNIVSGKWTEEVNLNEVANGMYLLQISADDQKMVRRFEVRR